MTRRKSAYLKWTLVILVVGLCPTVHTRPQENSVKTEITTENAIRYSFKNDSFISELPSVIRYIQNIINNRTSRFVKGIATNIPRHQINRNGFISYTKQNKQPTQIKLPVISVSHEKRKANIKKVLTKWNDEVKYEDLNFSPETSTEERDPVISTVKFVNKDDSSTENVNRETSLKRHQLLNYNDYKPNQHQYSEETEVYSTNIQIVDSYTPRPPYLHTKRPSPTPIITNVGYPKPWQQNSQVIRKPTTQKPVRVTNPLNYNYHNSIHNYPSEFEVTTFQPTSAYTERIVIRPEEYSGSPDECPTIYLTLNNTFQGQAKEACPDLNIAVNTNVINKNVIIESEEEEADSLFPGGFGLPLGEDNSTPDESSANDYYDADSAENQEAESASVEQSEFSNYNSANGVPSENSGTGGLFSPSSPTSALTKPGRPNKDDDDIFSFSSLVQFFRPAISALSWLASINPFAVGLFPMFLAPIAFLFAGSGIAALFSPFLGREAPKIVHVYRPYWHWDDEIKTWHLHSFPNNRKQYYSRSSKENENVGNSVKPTFFFKLKEMMKLTTDILREKNNNRKIRKSKKRKRDVWSTRVNSTSQSAVPEPTRLPVTSSSSSSTSSLTTAGTSDSSRDVKNKAPIRDSIKLVANQLLDKPTDNDKPVAADIRIPPKLKTQAKNKNKLRNDDNEEPEKSHAGVAVPVSMEELENEPKVKDNESTTSNEGISTWVLVSNPVNNNSIVSTEPTKIEETKKQKPVPPKNKKKQPVKPAKRPVIASTNKSDLIAGGSAMNENVYNKIKDTVLSNVQKNKTPATQKTTTVKVTTTTTTTTKPPTTTKKEEIKAPIKAPSETKVTTKPKKKKNKNKNRSTTTEEPYISDSALLPMEAKGPEIELEVSTPPVTTKKPKRSSTKKKTKTKKRKTTKPKPAEGSTSVAEVKTGNKTKSAKPAKKPQAPVAITSQLYNYLSREVMPSVGVGVLGLASIVGIASYFLYPFSTPVRRTFEVDKRDDLYKNNAEDYANEGNGQAEEEMLGTVLAGMPAHAKNKLNPYAGQTAYVNNYPTKKPQQDIRYRHVAAKYEPNYNVRYPQQKTGLAHGAVYSKPVNYSPHYDTRHAYTTEGKFNFDKLPTSYAPYQPAAPAVEPIYAAPQTGPASSGVSSYGNDALNSVVYGVKPSSESDFKPVYPFEGQFYNEGTSSPDTYAPTSLYLGSNNEAEEPVDDYQETSSEVNEVDESKFVVGNVPKELSDSATLAVVPEHGPRKLKRRKRYASVRRSISTSLEELLRVEKEKNNFLSNEIDDSIVMPIRNLAAQTENKPMMQDLPAVTPDVMTVFATSEDEKKEESTTIKNVVIESVSTIPVDDKDKTTTESNSQNDIESTTKTFRVYEVFSAPDATSSPLLNDVTAKVETTTAINVMTETTTELKSETTSILPSTESSFTDSKDPGLPTLRPTPIIPDVATYPPLNEPLGFFSFLKRLVDFKVRLGLSILQSTSDSLNRFLKNVETPQTSNTRFAKASALTKKKNL